MCMKTSLLSLALVLFWCLGAAAQNNSKYDQALTHMLEVGPWEPSYMEAFHKMATVFTERIPEEKAGEWKQWLDDYAQRAADELMAQVAPVYAKHLSLEDLEEFTRFFQTPVGKRCELEIPAISQELAPLKLEFLRKVGDEQEAKYKELK